jgi:hypothetical protein
MLESRNDHINKVESEILEIYDTKVNIWNVFSLVNKIKKLLARFWIFFIDVYKNTEKNTQVELDILEIILKMQKQIDIINSRIKKIEGE